MNQLGIKRLWSGFEQVADALRRASIVHCSIPFSLRPLLACVLAHRLGRPVFYVALNEEWKRKAFKQAESLRFLFGVGDLSVNIGDFSEEWSDVLWQRSLVPGKPVVSILGADDIRREIVDLTSFEERSLLFTSGEERKREEVLDGLFRMGYERKDFVWERGEMAVRGEVLDFFPPDAEMPLRTYWWGNRLETIRRFHPETQRTADTIQRILVLPRSGSFRKIPLLGLLRRESAVLFWDGAYFETTLFRDTLQVFTGLSPYKDTVTVDLPAGKPPSFQGNIPALVEWLKAEYWTKVFLVLPSEKLELMRECLSEEQVAFTRRPEDEERIVLFEGYPSEGFLLDDEGIAVLSATEIFGTEIQYPRTRKSSPPDPNLLRNIKPGDYLVHEEHGIGIYRGSKEMSLQGIRKAYITIEYAAGDQLHVPVESLFLVQKYVASGDTLPRMSRLGKDEWLKIKQRVKKSVEEVARELLDLYARRQIEHGHAFPPDESWARKLELSFPFVETADQRLAIDDVKRDMELPRPMDRLVCGDVGYGKTEVAVRAAFKAVMGGKQVAVLSPTTILSEQHYVTFKERLRRFPVRVEVLNRFKSPPDQKRILDEIARGTVDIVIGTHRLLSRDIAFHDLGLLVVDEEQRFGVMHKERLKRLKAAVDILTLTATPIPRTLYLSLIGTRDISIIATPPQGRKAVHTQVLPRKASTIREAVEYELNRGGQVFYVCPRIRELLRVREELEVMFPGASMALAHGRMSGSELERVMEGFYERKIQLLLCTTIIEIGLDVPNANTLIVDPATLFGLAQLYQLRGRIGRFDRDAFAYFFYPSRLTLESRERLEAILEYSELGSGLKLATRDMEIRGAGNILGAEQHGFIQEIGFSLYTRMIQDEIARLKGEEPDTFGGTSIALKEEAFIPESYMDESERFGAYQRILRLREPSDVEALREEWEDHRGRIPPEALKLLNIAKLRGYGKISQVESIEERDGKIFMFGSLECLVRLSEASKERGVKGTLAQHQGRTALKIPVVGIDRLLEIFEGFKASTGERGTANG
ncbi:MAG TPA: transcription-repair coupling factor [Atribacteraceae bacterium]|nr:transcription-repair coupling factor [Atribacteraceae bacterium]